MIFGLTKLQALITALIAIAFGLISAAEWIPPYSPAWWIVGIGAGAIIGLYPFKSEDDN